jgi:uncharacterized protein (DUF1800 family)
MGFYLDNVISIGPNSRFGQRTNKGLNENFGRELLELHTLGVDGGYDQRDVTELAKVITGWSIGGAVGPGANRLRAQGNRNARASAPADAAGDEGEFHFRAAMHEPGDKTVLGRRFEERGVEEGEEVLAMLARQPATAKHLAMKLARHFVADEPPAKLVERLADVYLDNDGELAPVYRALIAADDAWREPLAKYKTPQDFVISTFRALDHVPESLQQITGNLNELGQRPFVPGSPAGWPDVAAHWNGSDPLLKRIEWGAAVGRRVGGRLNGVDLAAAVLGPVNDATLAAIRAASPSAGQALALLIAAPEFQRR